MPDHPTGPTPRPRRSAAGLVRASFGRVRVMGASRWRPPLGQRRVPRVIAVGSASAGAGKTVVASNLAVAIAGLGPSVVLVDFDLAAPHLHELFGISRPPSPPPATGRKRVPPALDASLVGTGIRNLLLAPSPSLDPMAQQQKGDLVRQLHELEGDVVVVDVGARNRDDLFDFFATGALRLVVSGPEREELAATFAFLEGAARRAAQRYGGRARQALEHFRGGLIGNLTAAPDEVESFHAFSRLVRDHLGIALPVLGCLRDSDRIPESIRARRPLLARRGLDENVRVFHDMAEVLMMNDAVAGDGCDLRVGAPVATAPASLPADLKRYLRKHPRYPVDWAARLELPSGSTEVRVLDVSYAGVAVEVFADLAVGDQATLSLYQFPDQPALRVVVKNVLSGLRRVGLAFVEPGVATARLEAAAVALTESGKVRAG